MTNLIVEISKYLMILLMAVYTYANFRFFSFPDMERKRRVCARQNRAMFAIHFLAYLVMFLKTEDEGMQAMLLAFYGAQVVFFLCYIYLYRLLYRNVSRLLVNNACMLLCVGFIMLTRLSMAKGLDKALRQFAIVVISAALAWLVHYIMERVWPVSYTHLYPAMEDFAIDIMLVKDSTARSIRLDLPHFTLVGATTREMCIRDRAPIDKSSTILTMFLAALILAEGLGVYGLVMRFLPLQ